MPPQKVSYVIERHCSRVIEPSQDGCGSRNIFWADRPVSSGKLRRDDTGFSAFFECSCRSGVSRPACRSCLIILRFILKSAKVINPFFADEIIFTTVTSVLGHSFRIRDRSAASRSDNERDDSSLRREPFAGGPLHPSKAKRGTFEKIPSDLSRAPRLQSPLFYPTGRRRAQCEVWKLDRR